MQPLPSVHAVTLEANMNPLNRAFVVGVVYQLVVAAEGAGKALAFIMAIFDKNTFSNIIKSVKIS